MRVAHCHLRRQNATSQGRICSWLMILSTIRVARWMYCGQGSKLSSLRVVGCAQLWSSIGADVAACVGVMLRRRGVPMISRSMRRFVRSSLVIDS